MITRPTRSPTPAGRDRLRLLLATALRGEKSCWPELADGSWADAVSEAIRYHGVAGLLAQRMEMLDGWPAQVLSDLRQQALAEAMWELQHRPILTGLLGALEADGVRTLLLKGSAIAYALYDPPATRRRGDSDLLVPAADVDRARAVLRALGFDPADSGVAFEWQQDWRLRSPDGSSHCIDLHWEVFNSPALADVLPADECFADGRPVPGLGPSARAMDPARLLLHSCVHRALHQTAPYMIGGKTYFGGDRLIWSVDIHRLTNALSADEWARFADLAAERRVAATCLDALAAASSDLGGTLPSDVEPRLQAAAPRERPYLRTRRPYVRAGHDLLAIPGFRGKIFFLRSRLLPTESMLRAKYPGMAGAALPLLHLRRLGEALRRRRAA